MYINSSSINLNSSHSYSKNSSYDVQVSSKETPVSTNFDKVQLSDEFMSTNKQEQGVVNAVIERLVDTNFRGKEVNAQIEQHYAEKESVDFNSVGIVDSSNGSIAFNIDISMSREFVVENKISASVFIDPLVVNLDGGFTELSTKKFSFDIDNDGTTDQISLLKKGSAFLAYDKNGNGVVDGGGELFGTKTNNGFEELRAYDSDQNGWIDENDEIFNKLQVWRKDDSGDSSLVALGEVGIGAIYLESTSTQYSYRDSKEGDLGRLHSSGVVLKENGEALAISEVEFAKEIKDISVDKKEEPIRDNATLTMKKLKSSGYADNSDNSNKEDALEKLQARLKMLESKMSKLDKSEDIITQRNLSVQIEAVRQQIFSLLD